MTRFKIILCCLFLALPILCGCGQSASSPSGGGAAGGSAAQEKFLLQDEPADGRDVIAAREVAKDGDEIVIVGRVGGSVDPWVADRAAFSIVDRSLIPCSEREGDTCPTPWDYCCDLDKLPQSKALIKLVDDRGQLVATDARKLLPIRELQTVVVRGTAQVDDAGNLSVLASGVFLKP